MAISWELWWQITLWIVIIVIGVAVIKGSDHGKGPK